MPIAKRQLELGIALAGTAVLARDRINSAGVSANMISGAVRCNSSIRFASAASAASREAGIASAAASSSSI
ncbi:MAG: hypothetical protein WKG01_27425 [Kofleriaceae bacterium]